MPAGRHSVKLTYETPGFKLGILLSVIGIGWFVIFSLIRLILNIKNRRN
jgi:uncharacterized membrane protein YfhO